MTQPHNPSSHIAKLINRSSLGTRNARQARSRVPVTTAQAVIARSNGLAKSPKNSASTVGTGQGARTYTHGVRVRQSDESISSAGGGVNMATSKSDASKAGKLLSSKSASKAVKSVAASDLAQTKKSGGKSK